MTVSVHAPDVEIIEEGETSDFEEFPEEEHTPIRGARSPVPAAPSAAQAHAGMLDPWAESDLARARAAAARSDAPRLNRGFEEEEVVTSAKRNAAQAPPSDAHPGVEANLPPAPKAPRFPSPRRPVAPPMPEEPDTTTYRQINPRAQRAAPTPRPRRAPQPDPKPRPLGPLGRPASARIAAAPPATKPQAPPAPNRSARPAEAPSAPSAPPALDLLELVDSVELPEELPKPRSADPSPPHIGAAVRTCPLPPISRSSSSSRPLGLRPRRTPRLPLRPLRAARPRRPPRLRPPRAASRSRRLPDPTAPPPGSIPAGAVPSAPPTRPRAGGTLLDLAAVEALADLPDDAREAFGAAATMHTIARDEEVSHFALALVVEGSIDVSATIVDAPALRLEKNAILRSRGTLVPGVPLRLVCASAQATLATWNDAAVAEAFRTCPWVEEDLRVVTDRVQAAAGVTMGPLGDRFDQSLRAHFTGKLTLRSLAPGEVLVAQGKPAPIAVVGIGEILVTKNGERSETLRPGDFVFPSQTLAHGKAPATVAAGPGGAVVLYGDRAVSQELLMGFPPLLEVLASI